MRNRSCILRFSNFILNPKNTCVRYGHANLVEHRSSEVALIQDPLTTTGKSEPNGSHALVHGKHWIRHTLHIVTGTLKEPRIIEHTLLSCPIRKAS